MQSLRVKYLLMMALYTEIYISNSVEVFLVILYLVSPKFLLSTSFSLTPRIRALCLSLLRGASRSMS